MGRAALRPVTDDEAEFAATKRRWRPNASASPARLPDQRNENADSGSAEPGQSRLRRRAMVPAFVRDAKSHARATRGNWLFGAMAAGDRPAGSRPSDHDEVVGRKVVRRIPERREQRRVRPFAAVRVE